MSAETKSPADKTPFGLIALLLLAGMTAAGQFAKISATFPLLRAHWPEAGAELGFVVSIVSLIGVAGGVIAGGYVARLGFRRVLIAGLALGALMSLVQALMPPLWIMLITRAIEGASHIALVVAIPTLIAHLSLDRHRPYTMTLWGSYFGVTYALTAWIAPALTTQGPALLYLLHGLVMIAIAGLIWRALPPGTVPRVTTPSPGLIGILKQHPKIYASPRIAAPGLGWFFYTLTFVALLTVLPAYVPEENREVQAFWMPIAGIILSLTLGAQLLRRISAVRIILLGLVLASACLIAIWVWPQALWPPILTFAALGLVQGASFAAVPQLNPEPQDQALSNGAMAQMGNLGNLIGTPILLLMTNGWGLTGAVIFALLAYLCCAAVHLQAAYRRV